MWPLYDWAQDDRALSYTPPRQKYLCPKGHECYESEKEFMKGYVLCWQCETDIDFYYKNNKAIKSKGLYTPIYMCKKI